MLGFHASCELPVAKMSPGRCEQVFHQLDHFNFGVSAALPRDLQDRETGVLVGRQSKGDQHPPGAFQEPAYLMPTKCVWGGYCCYPHFTDAETEAQVGVRSPQAQILEMPKAVFLLPQWTQPQSGHLLSRRSAGFPWSSQGWQEWMQGWGVQGRGPYPCQRILKAQCFQHPLCPLDGAAVGDIDQRF